MKWSMKAPILLFFFIAQIQRSAAGIRFGGLDLNNKDRLLFTVETDVSGATPYSALFVASIKDGTAADIPDIITCYPEEIELVSNGKQLQIRNRYGTALYTFKSSCIEWVERFETIPTHNTKRVPVSVSPDGKWECFVKKTYTAHGPLVIENVSTHKQILASDSVNIDYDSVPVKWSPDSSAIVYEKDGNLYFCNPEALLKNIQIEEKFRRIGAGNIHSICFTKDGGLVYIDRDIVYNVSSGGLYTLSLFSSFIDSGNASAVLPLPFNPCTDIFAVNNDGSEILIITSHRLISYYKVHNESFSYAESLYSEPFVDGGGSAHFSVIWPDGDKPVVKVDSISTATGEPLMSLYRIDKKKTLITAVKSPDCHKISPDNKKIAVGTSKGVIVYTLPSGFVQSEYNGESIASICWKDNASLYIGGRQTIQEWNITDGSRSFLFLSTAQKARWSVSGGAVMSVSGASSYEYDTTTKNWKETSFTFPDGHGTVQNGRFRVYTDKTPNAFYDNALYVRTLTGDAVTKPLLLASVKKTAERKKVSLVFEAMDNADGLCRILYSLSKYRLQGTFFINGDFIKRYPMYTRQIAAAGHECASMFYTSSDLVQEGFLIDETFIRRGLARTEDEFYSCTGSELSLLWHAPFYRTSALIKGAGNEAGYTYVSSSTPPLDTVTLESCANGSVVYNSAGEIIEQYVDIVRKNSGGIISIATGVSGGFRTDYVYDKLDLLINELFDAGFDIVPASRLVINAK